MDERIKDHLMRLNKYYLLLLDAQKVPYDEFADDEIHQSAVERFLQLAIESCLNIGNRLISLYQFKKPVKAPETYADIFIQIQKLGAIESEFASQLVEMAKFRNRLVHMYWDIDIETLYHFLQSNIDDFKKFEQCIVDYINSNKLDPM
jgi:uncharacterized protein YutE (UPF0331/DUF86 family)